LLSIIINYYQLLSITMDNLRNYSEEIYYSLRIFHNNEYYSREEITQLKYSNILFDCKEEKKKYNIKECYDIKEITIYYN